MVGWNTLNVRTSNQSGRVSVNVLLRELSEICGNHLLDEKWVLAPSLRAGHEWLMTVARSGQPVVNGHVKTIARLALDLAGPLIADRELEFVSSQQGSLLVDRIMQRLRTPGEGYLLRLSPSVPLSETVYRAIDALRCAALDSEDLPVERFEVDVKGREIREILREYARELHERKWVDRADVLQLAIKRLELNNRSLPNGVLILVPRDIEVLGLESRLLDALPAKQRIWLEVDQPAPEPATAGESLTDARLLRWLPSPADAPPPTSDGSAHIFPAIGEVNEIRGVLRRCLAENIPLDQVELLCTDVETYIPLIYETFARLLPDDASLDDMPVTFQEGIPARRFRPGRALFAWLAWMRDDFPQRGLTDMIQEGLLDIPGHDPDTMSFSFLAAIFRSIGIGFGRERYLATLTKYEAAWELRRHDLPALRDEDGELREHSEGVLATRLAAIPLLRRLVESLLELAPRPSDGTLRVFELAQKFLEKFTRRESQLDNYARRFLITRIKDVRATLDREGAELNVNASSWLANLPDEAWVGGLGPRGGCLHVAHVLAGGHSGRPHTFIVGLDDGRFPGAGLQDPILLDQERQALSHDLPTSARELAKRVDLLARLFARLRGHVTLSYACHNLADDSQMFPSSVVLSAFRILSGQHDGDQAALNRWLPPPESFAPDRAEKALTDSEWWLWRMSGTEEVLESRELITRLYPHLGRGFTLALERESDRFTVYDGWIPEPGAEIDPTVPEGPALSASQLETLGQCPLKYFFRYVLKIGAPEELSLDPETWLEPLARGLLLHEVFELFIKELIERGDAPDFARDEQRLLEILNDRIEHNRREIPPPNEAVYRREVRRLQRTVRIFLRGEEAYSSNTGNRPRYLEASIGLMSERPETPLDTVHPVEIRLPDDSSLRARARIDRVDQVGGADANAFAIWDYKTGSTWKYKQDPRPFWEGRVVQHILSILVMNARLKAIAADVPGAKIDRFGFFFPSEKGAGERIEFAPDELEPGSLVLAQLARIAATGAFLATTRDDLDCSLCDYKAICGDVAALASASTRKLSAASNAILEPYRNLRHGEANDEAHAQIER
jgi:PD-(D/E)XK nuclease superfamily